MEKQEKKSYYKASISCQGIAGRDRKTKGIFMRELQKLVQTEVEASYTKEEIMTYVSFEAFWNDVKTKNFYEEERKDGKLLEVKIIYERVFDELRNL